MSSLLSGMIAGPSSFGRPMPSKTRPRMSRETASSSPRPRNRTLTVLDVDPVVPSKSCTSAVSPSTSSTRPRRISPFGSSISTSSLVLDARRPARPASAARRSPATVRYSSGAWYDPPLRRVCAPERCSGRAPALRSASRSRELGDVRLGNVACARRSPRDRPARAARRIGDALLERPCTRLVVVTDDHWSMRNCFGRDV